MELTFTVSLPIPVFPPVTIVTFPVRSGMFLVVHFGAGGNTCAIKERVPPEREFPIVILKVLEGYSVNNGDLIGHSERRAEILKYAGESESVLSLPLHTKHKGRMP